MEQKKLKILIADDEDGLRLSMAGIIELEGHEVLTAVDGYEAIALAKQNTFDIAFLDIKMPGINGVETFKEIKKISPETIVIMMTAYAVQHLIKEAINEGAYACINKPFDMDKTMETIRDVSRKPFVVVIDDDAELYDSFNKKFRELGINVVAKSSGMEGVELVKRKIPDVIFLDVTKNNRDAVETFKKIREFLGDKYPKTVLLGNGPGANALADEIKKLGKVDFMQKPLNIEGLKNAVAGVLEKGKKLKICIVDDDKPFCDYLKNVLASGNYEVETAHSGDEILKKIIGEMYKIVILDIHLPDINGVEVYEKIKSLNPEVGVIFISGFAQDNNMESVIQKNNYTYLHKPFDPENLIQMIENIKETKLQNKY